MKIQHSCPPASSTHSPRVPGLLRIVSLAAMAISLLVASMNLGGCTSVGTMNSAATTSTTTSTFLAVSDSGNNRVLLYSMPSSGLTGLPPDNGPSASVVLGQSGFTTGDPALTAAGLNNPLNTSQDSAGNIYVSDYINNRVLQFKPPFTNGGSANLVIGQPDFFTGAPNTTQNGLGAPFSGFIGGPAGVALDANGNLWVVDFGNSRVLEYEPPFASGMNASLVIGQPDFETSTAATTNSGLQGPQSIAFDHSGNLWLADTYNNRVLEFEPPFVSGMAASLVVGQLDFVSNGAATTAAGLDFPTGIAFDSSGSLWVADTNNNRVLQFLPPLATGMSAALVLGQPDFTSNPPSARQNWLNAPIGMTFDSSGNLYLTDSGNNRTLMFVPPFTNDQDASNVLGQTNFTSANATTTAVGESSPFAVSMVVAPQ